MSVSSIACKVVDSIKVMWNKETKGNKYLSIIAICIPSYILFREMYWFLYRKYYSLPPGPNGLPILGIFLQWNFNMNKRIQLSNKYGQILYTTWIGAVPMIVLNSSKLVKQIFPKKEFLNRDTFFDPSTNYYHSCNSVGKSAVMHYIMSSGDEWKNRRKLSQDTLFKVLNNKNAGNLFKETFETEVKPYLSKYVNDTDKPWYPREIIDYITFNTIYSTIFGKKLGRNSKLFSKMRKDFEDTFDLTLLDALVVKIPFASYFYGEKLDKVRDSRNETLLQLVNERVNENDGKNKSSYIDYMHEMVVDGELTQDEEIADLVGTFAAGTDTTGDTLEFGFTLLAKNQNIQDKVRKELLEVMGKEYNLKLVHKCPLFRAAVHEIIRLSAVVYCGIHHLSFNDYWITLDDGRKYKIPKNCSVFANMEYIHVYGGKNEKWKRVNKDEIILENFLTEDDDGGIRFVVNESFVAFGVGKRDCVGRQLALKEIQYTLGYLLMNYKISFWNKEDVNRDITSMRKSNLVTASLHPALPLKVMRVR